MRRKIPEEGEALILSGRRYLIIFHFGECDMGGEFLESPTFVTFVANVICVDISSILVLTHFVPFRYHSKFLYWN